MNVDTILVEIEKFIVFSAGSQPGSAELALLAAVAVAVWISTAMARRVLGFVVVLVQTVMVAVASLSTVVVACLVVAFLALTG